MQEGTVESEPLVFRLIYRSRNRIPADSRKSTLGELFSEARSKNKSKHITGALLVSDDCFVQTLEGEEEAVRNLYRRIEQDPRHDLFSILEAEPVVDRVFARWSMAEVSSSPGGPDTFLLAHRDGISPAASLRATPEQESILEVMRTAARGGAQEQEEVKKIGNIPVVPRQENARLRPLSM